MVFGTVIVTLVYQPVIDLAAVRLGWVLIIAGAVASALAAVALAISWAARSGGATNPSIAERLAGQSLTSAARTLTKRGDPLNL